MNGGDDIARDLASVYSSLPLAGDPMHQRWLTIWMMLVGCRYLLRKADAFCNNDSINYEQAAVFSQGLLEELQQGRLPNEDEWSKGEEKGWPAGFYLISAEHRIANCLDRLTIVFIFQTPLEIRGKGRIAPRCNLFISKACALCHKWVREPAISILSGIDEGVDGGTNLAKVWDRVNTIKHGPDVCDDGVGQMRTRERWNEATDALREMIILLREFGDHLKECPNTALPPRDEIEPHDLARDGP